MKRNKKEAPPKRMGAEDRVRILRAAFVLLPLSDRTINLWVHELDAILELIGKKRPGGTP